MSIDQLLRIVDAYRAATGLADATVSAKFLSRGNRIRQLRAGGDMGARNVLKVIEKLSSEWPPDAVWPEDVVRPPAFELGADAQPCNAVASFSSTFTHEAAE